MVARIGRVLCIIVSIAVQGFGHSMELQQVPPFTGPRDFVRRLYAEAVLQFLALSLFRPVVLEFKSAHSRTDERVA